MNKALNTLQGTAEHTVLFALWDLARQDVHATVLRVCDAAGLGRSVVEATLTSLERAGWVDRSRVRLSLTGLTIVMSLGAPKVARRNARIGRVERVARALKKAA